MSTDVVALDRQAVSLLVVVTFRLLHKLEQPGLKSAAAERAQPRTAAGLVRLHIKSKSRGIHDKERIIDDIHQVRIQVFFVPNVTTLVNDVVLTDYHDIIVLVPRLEYITPNPASKRVWY